MESWAGLFDHKKGLIRHSNPVFTPLLSLLRPGVGCIRYSSMGRKEWVQKRGSTTTGSTLISILKNSSTSATWWQWPELILLENFKFSPKFQLTHFPIELGALTHSVCAGGSNEQNDIKKSKFGPPEGIYFQFWKLFPFFLDLSYFPAEFSQTKSVFRLRNARRSEWDYRGGARTAESASFRIFSHSDLI